ncbi:MAG: efflux RND transporter periplasmic adaptor subunit [bacterium]
MIKNNYSLTVVLVLLMVSLFSCNQNRNTKNSGAYNSTLLVDAVVVQPQVFKTEIKTNSNLLAFEQVEIKAPVSGTILAIYIKEGQVVKKGQPIIKIDDRSWKAELKGLKALLLSAEADLDRKRELLPVEGASQQDIDEATAKVDELEAQIDQLNVNIDLANVEAPFDGKVGMRDFSVGTYLSQGQAIMELAQSWKLKVDFNMSWKLKVDFNMPGRYRNQLKPGKNIRVIYGNDTIESPIYAVSPVADKSSRMINVRALINNNSLNFVPGDYAEVIIPLNINDSALVVPTDCVVPELNNQTVFLYKAGKAKRTVVELGSRNDTRVEILHGIHAGDTILSSGLLQVKDNFPVSLNKVTTSNAL